MIQELLTLAELASKVNRTPDCIYKWKLQGRLNRFTGKRVFCEMTRTPSGAWAVTPAQYDAFIAALNEKP